jgi:hypothetical protein
MSSVAHGKDDLTRVRGIGATYVSKLVHRGLTTFGQVATASTDELHEITRCPVATIDRERWQMQARELAADSTERNAQPASRHIFTVRLNVSTAGSATYTLDYGHADDGVTTSASEPAQEWDPYRVVAYIEERARISATARTGPSTSKSTPTDGNRRPSAPKEQGSSRTAIRDALLLVSPQILPRAVRGETDVDIATEMQLSDSATATFSVIVRRPADGQPEPAGQIDRHIEAGQLLQARVPCDLGKGVDEGEIAALIHLHAYAGDTRDAARLVADATMTPVD